MNKQLEIQRYLLKVEQATKAEILENVPFGYYHNGMKHLGDILTRMVQNGLLERVKKGVYRNLRNTKIKETINPSQTDLF
jgi:predicted transcriptional regulator of viral defense system